MLLVVPRYFCLNSSVFTRITESRFRKLSRITTWTPVPVFTMQKQNKALLSSSEALNQVNPPWSRQKRVAIVLALFSTTSGALLLASCLVVNAATPPSGMSSDAEKWKKIGEENAHRDLDLFDGIASGLAAGSKDYAQLHSQLALLQQQIDEVGDNNRILIPQIVDVIMRINSFLEGDSPSMISKLGLKALIWYVDGKRDNKSYYLLDGAQMWAQLRLQILQKYGGSTVKSLSKQLEKMRNDTSNLRDELDDTAQIFVKGIKEIHSMTGDIASNLGPLKAIAKHLLVISEQKDTFLANTKALEHSAANLTRAYDKQ